MTILRRVSWGAVMSLLFIIAAIVTAVRGEDVLALVLGMCSITWALLRLADIS